MKTGDTDGDEPKKEKEKEKQDGDRLKMLTAKLDAIKNRKKK